MNNKKQFCKKGHDKTVTGIVGNGRCKVCREEYMKNYDRKETEEQKARRAERQRQYRKNDPERHREYDRKYYQKNPEKRREKSRKYREDHKNDPKKPVSAEKLQYLIEYKAEYRAKNKEKDIAYRLSRKAIQDAYNREYYALYKEDLIKAAHDYYWSNREDIAEKSRQKRLENPELHRRNAKIQKHNRRAAIGQLTPIIIEQLWSEGNGVCAYCLDPVSLCPTDDNHWRIEHCIPISRGGTHNIDNLVVACQKCNNRKYTKTVLEYCFEWPKVTDRYDFFVTEKLSEEDNKKLVRLHEKHRQSHES